MLNLEILVGQYVVIEVVLPPRHDLVISDVIGSLCVQSKGLDPGVQFPGPRLEQQVFFVLQLLKVQDVIRV